jgi:hypothetical protein
MKNIDRVKKIINEEVKAFFEKRSAEPITKPKTPTTKPGEKIRKNPLAPPKTAPQTNPKAKKIEEGTMGKIIQRYLNLKK